MYTVAFDDMPGTERKEVMVRPTPALRAMMCVAVWRGEGDEEREM